jgi:nitroreductase
VGGAGVLLAALCLVVAIARGRFIPPEGKMLDAATFCFGVGIFTLTIALLLPLAVLSPVARRRWRRAYYVFAVYGLVLEPVQAFRGLDPRFTEEGGQVDVMLGIIFGLTALSNIVVFVILGIRFFRSAPLADEPALRLGIRYGVAAVALSFGVGIAMSFNSGRQIGQGGNLLVSHALGVHGIQAIPAVSVIVRMAGTRLHQLTLLHAAGIGWLAACVAALWQALAGHSLFEPSGFTAMIMTGLVVWAAVAVWMLVSWSRVTGASRSPRQHRVRGRNRPADRIATRSEAKGRDQRGILKVSSSLRSPTTSVEAPTAMSLDLDTVDTLLSTTRAVRRRLDPTRPVPASVIADCLRLAVQAPTAADQQNWRWVVVTQRERRAAIAEMHRSASESFVQGELDRLPSGAERRRFESVMHLVQNLAAIPVHVIAYVLEPELDGLGGEPVPPVLLYGSIFPAVWSFQLALRARGLGTTPLFVPDEATLNDIVGAPDTARVASLLPVAYFTGETFKPAQRRGLAEVAFENQWEHRLTGT